MSAISTAQVVDLFKEVYGDLQNLLPEDFALAKDIPFSQKEKVGEKFVEAVVLTRENGLTLGGNGMTAFELEAAVAGAVQQAEVEPYSVVIPSVIPWGVISRTAGGGPKSFFSATKHIIKNNLRSHSQFLENLRLYGQSDDLLGHVSYASATYRGQAFVNGSGTIAVNGTDITFTNGINAANNMILLQPGEFAAGLWVGQEGLIVQQVDFSGNVVNEMTLTSMDAEQGVLIFDTTPIAPTALPGNAGSLRLAYKGMAENKEAIGIQKILTSRGTLFGINQSKYALFNGICIDNDASKFTFNTLQTGIAAAVNRGGLDGDVKVYCNPRTWATLNTTEAGSREYDGSYKSSGADNGFERITYFHQTGKAEICAHRSVKEGEVYALHAPDWSRSGSAEVAMKIPGMDADIIFPLQNQAAMGFRSFSDQYLFCHSPAKSIIWKNVNDEAAS